MNEYLVYETTDAFGKKVKLKIRNFDKDFIKLEINGEDATLHYDNFAEFTNKCNQFIRNKRFQAKTK